MNKVSFLKPIFNSNSLQLSINIITKITKPRTSVLFNNNISNNNNNNKNKSLISNNKYLSSRLPNSSFHSKNKEDYVCATSATDINSFNSNSILSNIPNTDTFGKCKFNYSSHPVASQSINQVKPSTNLNEIYNKSSLSTDPSLKKAHSNSFSTIFKTLSTSSSTIFLSIVASMIKQVFKFLFSISLDLVLFIGFFNYRNPLLVVIIIVVLSIKYHNKYDKEDQFNI